MRKFLSRFRDDQSGLAAEFALVLPLLLVFVLGTIDIGNYAYHLNRAEKATMVGARHSAVTAPIADEIASASYVNVNVGGVTVTQGERVPAAALGELTCTNTSCTCTVGPCPGTTFNSTAFNSLLNEMQGILPHIKAANVVVVYKGSGLGFAGDPNGPDLAPLIEVRLRNMTYRSIILSPFGGSATLPGFSYTLSAEDGAGTTSYH